MIKLICINSLICWIKSNLLYNWYKMNYWINLILFKKKLKKFSKKIILFNVNNQLMKNWDKWLLIILNKRKE